MGELLQRMGSAEVAEWIAELGQLRPEDEERAMKEAEAESEGKKTPKPLTRADIADLQVA